MTDIKALVAKEVESAQPAAAEPDATPETDRQTFKVWVPDIDRINGKQVGGYLVVVYDHFARSLERRLRTAEVRAIKAVAERIEEQQHALAAESALAAAEQDAQRWRAHVATNSAKVPK